MDFQSSTPRPSSARLSSFPNRLYTASPLGSKRFSASAGRESLPGNDTLSVAEQIFHASSISPGRPRAVSFAPAAIARSNVFAPGASPAVAKRIPRPLPTVSAPFSAPPQSCASAPELFPQIIPDPPSNLTGEALTKRLPNHLEQRGSVYADQYLADLCPPGFDDDKRRQFFCILDLRRLKYAANEIFAKKDWKLNILNFSKEFEKSRSIIMLRYGLYEFKTVKPSEEVLRKWRAAHGLPDPNAAPAHAGRTAPSTQGGASKRKAEDDGRTPQKRSVLSPTTVISNKRQALERDGSALESSILQPSTGAGKNKRKVLDNDDLAASQPAKTPRSTPSATKSLFESIANDVTTTPAFSNSVLKSVSKSASKAMLDHSVAKSPIPASTTKLPGTTVKSGNNSLARSVFENLKSGSALQPTTVAGNIFGYLSDASSARNSVVDADAESLSGSEPDTENAAAKPVQPAPPANQTWNIASPIKFAPPSTAPSSSSFGSVKALPSPSVTFQSSATLGTRTDDDHPATSSHSGSNALPTSDSDKENSAQPKQRLASTFSAATTAPSLFSSLQSKALPGAVTSSFTPLSGTPKLSETDSASRTILSPTMESGSTNSATLISKDAAPHPILADAPTKTTESLPASVAKPSPSVLFGAPSTAQPMSLFLGSYSGLKTDTTAKDSQAPIPAAVHTPVLSAIPATASTLSPAPGSGPPSSMGSLGMFSDAAKQNNIAILPHTSSVSVDPLQTSLEPSASLPTSNAFFTIKSPTKASKIPSFFAAPKIQAFPATLFGGSPMKSDTSVAATPIFGGNALSKPQSSLFQFAAGNSAVSTTVDNKVPRIFGQASSIVPPTAPVVSGASFTFTAGGGNAGNFMNPFSANSIGSSNAGQPSVPSASGSFNLNFSTKPTSALPVPTLTVGNSFSFSAGPTSTPTTGGLFQFGTNGATTAANSFPTNDTASTFKQASSNAGSGPAAAPVPVFGVPTTAVKPVFAYPAVSAPSQPQQQPIAPTQSIFAPNPGLTQGSMFSSLNLPIAGSTTTSRTNSPFLFGGSSIAATPATGTLEPVDGQVNGGKERQEDEEAPQAQLNLTHGGAGEEDELVLHEVRAKALKYIPPEFVSPSPGTNDKPGSKRRSSSISEKAVSPWSTQGVGTLRLLQHKTTGAVRILLRAEPRGHVALNRALLPNMTYTSNEKYVNITTAADDDGKRLETWMLQVKTRDVAKALAHEFETHKASNRITK